VRLSAMSAHCGQCTGSGQTVKQLRTQGGALRQIGDIGERLLFAGGDDGRDQRAGRCDVR
jgi:hypothetical protein